MLISRTHKGLIDNNFRDGEKCCLGNTSYPEKQISITSRTGRDMCNYSQMTAHCVPILNYQIISHEHVQLK